MSNSNQYGDLATQLLTESRRSTATNTLLKYNDVLVRSIIREQRDLEAAIESALTRSAALDPDDPDADPDAMLGGGPRNEKGEHAHMPTVLLYQTAISSAIHGIIVPEVTQRTNSITSSCSHVQV